MKSKGVTKICQILDSLQVVYSLEVNFGNSCHHHKPLPFDIMVVIRGKVGLIEFDGQQHFSSHNLFVKTNEDLIRQQTRDILKTFFAKEHFISLLRISYDASEQEIKDILVAFLTALNKSFQTPVYFFSNPQLYGNHIKLCL